MSVDPLASEFPAWSSYNYVLGNPIRFIDPDGRKADSIHEDEDGNFLAYYDDGDDGIYQHANGTTAEDLDVSYYYSGFSGGSLGGTFLTESATMEVTSTLSGVLVHGDGNYTIPAGETTLSMTETVWFGAAGGIVSGTYGNVEIKGGKDLPTSLQGIITSGNKGNVGGGFGPNMRRGGSGTSVEVLAATRGDIFLNQSVTGSSLEEMFSGVDFLSRTSVSSALKRTHAKGFNGKDMSDQIFEAKMHGAGVSSVGIKGSSHPVSFKKK